MLALPDGMLPALVGILGGAASGLVSWGATRANVNALTGRVDAVERDLSEMRAERTNLAIQITRIEERTAAMAARLDDLASSFRALLETRNAVRPPPKARTP